MIPKIDQGLATARSEKIKVLEALLRVKREDTFNYPKSMERETSGHSFRRDADKIGLLPPRRDEILGDFPFMLSRVEVSLGFFSRVISRDEIQNVTH